MSLDLSDDDMRERVLDSDWPSVHEFHGGVVLPEACIECGDEQAAPWHRIAWVA